MEHWGWDPDWGGAKRIEGAEPELEEGMSDGKKTDRRSSDRKFRWEKDRQRKDRRQKVRWRKERWRKVCQKDLNP